MRLLITGSTGFIGRNLKEYFQGKHTLSAPARTELDLLDEEAVEHFLRAGHFDIVLHCVNTNDVLYPERAGQMLEYNLRMFCSVARCAKYYGKLYHFGSGAVYGKEHYLPKMKESYFGQHIPSDPYGFSKYLISQLSDQYENLYELRLFGVFGKYEEWNRRFISNMIYQAMCLNTMKMDRDTEFDYLYIVDLCRILERIFETDLPEHHYNLCSGQPVHLLELAKFIQRETNSSAELLWTPGWKPPYTGDNSALFSVLGPLELTPLFEAVREMILYYRSNGFH